MRKDREVVEKIEDPFVRRAVRGAVHVRRYLPFYVMGLVWVLALSFFPTVNKDDSTALTSTGGQEALGSGEVVDNTTGGGGSDTTVPGATGTDGSTPGATGGTGGTGGSVSTGGGTGGTNATTGRTPVTLAPQTGKTRGGFECKPGVRQVPNSEYSVPCAPVFTGNNGGATYRGVTKDKILVIRRTFPESANSQAVDQVNQQAGFASSDTVDQVRDVFLGYFNKLYELYGRKVDMPKYESPNGDSTAEAQSKGREGACADATQVVEEIKAFGSLGGTEPFTDCAAQRKLTVFTGAAYFPERDYKKWHPYAWNTIMECERISYQVGEYIGKRLLNKKAKWAGDAAYQQLNRKFATYVPDNDGYQHCTNISEKVVSEQFGGPKPARYNYQLDISRFPDQAAAAVVQFKAAGATTIVNACDYISTIFLTGAASSQNYHPEWFIIGVAAQDTDNAARLFDQEQVNGHLFGMSQLGSTNKLLGPNSEPGRVYKAATGKTIPDGTTGDYFTLIHMFNMLQAAGPNLTPENVAKGAMTIPPSGAPTYAGGYWSMQDGSDGTKGAGDHTEVDDGREVYWDGAATGPDGKAGTYLETYGGKRYRNGEWPREEPPIYPKK